VKELEVYYEIYEHQKISTKIHQEISKLAQYAINFESYLQKSFSPFLSLIDEVVRVDETFYAINFQIFLHNTDGTTTC
jgi:hypothetical protein